MPWNRTWLFVVLVASAATQAFGQDKPAPPPDRKAGHSYHGAAFNDGPRQSAYLMPGMPAIDFPVTTKSPEAQKFVTQGLGQLHGFWNYEAERSFRQAAALDHDCAMAYWGMALANENERERCKSFAAEAVKRKDATTPREKLYIEALDRYAQAAPDKNKERDERWIHDLEKVLYEFPDDVEAKALMVGAIYKRRSEGNPINSFLAIDALLDQIFAKNPAHPAHHYRVHLWDDERPQLAVASAARCGQSSPGVAHMWHMSGHTFSKLKRYDDAAWQQEAAGRVDHAYMRRDRVLPDMIHNFAHNQEWLVTDLQYVGRVRDAVALSKNLISMPRHPKFNTMKGPRGTGWHGRRRLMETLAEYELWDEAIALCDTRYLDSGDDEEERVRRERLLGRAHFAKGNWVKASAVWAEVGYRLREQRQKQDRVGNEAADKAKAENKPAEEIEKLKNEARQREQGDLDRLQSAFDALSGWQALAAGDARLALDHLKKADIDRSVLALIKIQAGDVDEGLKDAKEQADNNPHRVPPLSRWVESLWKTGKKDEAKAALEKLREDSRSIDLQAPMFERIGAIAKELGIEGDWRMMKPPASDVGDRPALDTLGPFTWSPSPAPSFQVKDSTGADRSLASYAGKPVVIIFFLGHGCLHCAEQLHAFAPKLPEFQAAGIEMLAISSDDAEGLQKSIAAYKTGPLPIPLAADKELTSFKAWKCHDDFENQPLHGTFFVDAKGQLRWWDVGPDPFMDPGFVLDEAKRLMATPE